MTTTLPRSGISEEETGIICPSDTTPSKLKRLKCSLCRKVLKLPEDGDPRLASSYPSFVVGKLLSIVGSLSLLIGLVMRFFFLEDEGPLRAVSYLIVVASLFVFSVGAFLVIWATMYKSLKARKVILNETVAGPSRPASTLSSASFHSHSSTTGILNNKQRKGNVHSISVDTRSRPINS